MKNWQSVLMSPQATIRDALKVINAARSQFAMVVDASRCLLGTVSDGDIRRALLAGDSLEDPVTSCMCGDPQVAIETDSPDEVLALMRRVGLHQIPIIDLDRRVAGLRTVDDFLLVASRSTPVVIMAGGLGRRLNELTRDKPKPMLPVGGRPVLETIISRFVGQGFTRIWLAVNYRSDLIESYFRDGHPFGAEISYLREGKRLGTAGALSLLPSGINEPVIVSNADLVANMDYADLLDTHNSREAVATMAVREHECPIPFGVVLEKEGRVQRIEEKPVHRVTVNAGVYVLAPEAFRRVPAEVYFDMPQLFDALIAGNKGVWCHRVDGYWLDIGHRSEYELASAAFADMDKTAR